MMRPFWTPNAGGSPVVGGVMFWGSADYTPNASGTINLPDWIEAGDLMLVHDFGIGSAVAGEAGPQTIPPGWTGGSTQGVVNNAVPGSATSAVRVSQPYKIAEAGDAGSSVTFTNLNNGVQRKILSVFRPLPGLSVDSITPYGQIGNSVNGGGSDVPATTINTPAFQSHALAFMSWFYNTGVTPNPEFDYKVVTTSTTNGLSFWSYDEAADVPATLTYDTTHSSVTMPGYTGTYLDLALTGSSNYAPPSLELFGAISNYTGSATTSWSLSAANVFAGGICFCHVVRTGSTTPPSTPAGWTLITTTSDGSNWQGYYYKLTPTSATQSITWSASVSGVMWSMRLADLSPITKFVLAGLASRAGNPGATSITFSTNKVPAPAGPVYCLNMGWHRLDTSVTVTWAGSAAAYHVTGNSHSWWAYFQNPTNIEGFGDTTVTYSGVTSNYFLDAVLITFRVY